MKNPLFFNLKKKWKSNLNNNRIIEGNGHEKNIGFHFGIGPDGVFFVGRPGFSPP
jgi:hypothetical protein